MQISLLHFIESVILSVNWFDICHVCIANTVLLIHVYKYVKIHEQKPTKTCVLGRQSRLPVYPNDPPVMRYPLCLGAWNIIFAML